MVEINGILSEGIFYKEVEGSVTTAVREMQENVKEPIARCPKCQKPVYETDKAYVCSGHKAGCSITILKNALETIGKSKIISYEARRLLLGKTIKVTLTSRKGNPFKVDMIFNVEKNRIEFTSQ